MAVDENGNEIIIDTSSDAQKRINQLSDKVKTSSEERDAEKARADAEAAKTADALRERDFYAGFSDVVASNPLAKDHKDDILGKVKSGYTIQDATYAVLGAAGKLGGNAPVVESRPIAGGSAVTTPPQGGVTKSVAEMSREDKRAALLEAEARGDMSLT